MPDTSQMFPFKPKALAPPGSHPVPGGVFPVPLAAARLMQMLPPPTCFNGPFVDVERFVELFKTCQLPEETEMKANIGWPVGKLDKGTLSTLEIMRESSTQNQQPQQRRRTRLMPGTMGDQDHLLHQMSDEDSSSLPAFIPPPTSVGNGSQPAIVSGGPMQFPAGDDIYRMRQLKKARTELDRL